MLLTPQRAAENLKADLAKIRAKLRMRVGVVAGVLIVAAFQTNFDNPALLMAAAPLLGLGAFGILVVLALDFRDKKRAQAVHDSSVFRVPKRKDRK